VYFPQSVSAEEIRLSWEFGTRLRVPKLDKLPRTKPPAAARLRR
jgi:hypothetical protein